MKQEIHSERLLLRKIKKSDDAFILELVNSQTWLKYIGDRGVKTKAEVQIYIETHFLAIYKKYNFGFYCVIEKSSGNRIGICGITKRTDLELPDLGYALLEKHTGQGYTFEAASAYIVALKSETQIRNLLAIIDSQNEPSIKLIKKLNFDLLKEEQVSNSQKKLYYLLNL